MIAQVEGTVLTVRLDAVVVSVGGVGLLVHATPDTLAPLRPGRPVRLSTSLVVREDSLTLFGFVDDEHRDTFELLQTVTGVGPRLALATLAVHDPNALRVAVATEDVNALVKVPGIGRKGAQRILLDLADRLGPPGPDAPARAGGPVTAPPPAPTGVRGQVVIALTGLGWTARAAEDAVAAVADAVGEDDASALLRASLRHLGSS